MPRVEYVQVRCDKCRIETEPFQPYSDEDVAISAWNRRAEAALSAQVQDVAGIRAQAVEDVLSALTAHELYQYRPKAFRGFIEYARSTLINDEEGKIWRPDASPDSKHGDTE